jgi:predicted nuclease of predicted toxin-antitoxin system
LSPSLCRIAHDKGLEAKHVAHCGWQGLEDWQLSAKALDEMLIIVTNNRDDFIALVAKTEIHPGLVVLVENTRREQQAASFSKVLTSLQGRDDLINTVAEVDAEGNVTFFAVPPWD